MYGRSSSAEREVARRRSPSASGAAPPSASSSGGSASIWRASWRAEPLGAQQIADAHAAARGLALVGRADALAGGADALPGALLAQAVDLAVVRQGQVRARRR